MMRCDWSVLAACILAVSCAAAAAASGILGVPNPTADVVVAKPGGGGKFTTIGEALDLLRNLHVRTGYFTIYIKKGIYEEHLNIGEEKVALIGEGMEETVITGSRSRSTHHNTEQSATVAVTGAGFMARDIGFHNTAGGPNDGPAVAFSSKSNCSVLYRCEMMGYQDTLWAGDFIQFYRECRIWGTVDFIFGTAAAIFQDCRLYARRPASPTTHDVITAQGREIHGGGSGFVFQNCSVEASPLQNEGLIEEQTFLGRPWRHHAQVVFMMCSIAPIIHADGWVTWNNVSVDGGKAPPPEGHVNHTYFASYKNHRLGGNEPVIWNGFHEMKDDVEARKYTPRKFIHGQEWLPDTGVPHYLGLGPAARI